MVVEVSAQERRSREGAIDFDGKADRARVWFRFWLGWGCGWAQGVGRGEVDVILRDAGGAGGRIF